MNYQRIYDELIQRACLENRVKGGEVYYEAHHIVPKCMGGKGIQSQWKTHPNIILLTAREHFVAHRLLVEIHPSNYSLIWALHRMTFSKNKKTTRKIRITSRDYHRIRVIFSEMVKKQQTGKPKSENHKLNLSKSKQGTKMPESYRIRLKETMKGENNPNYGNKWTEEMKKSLSLKKKGIPSKTIWTCEMKKKMSESRKGIYNGTEETKKKISKTLTGRKASKETKKKQSESRANYLKNNPHPSLGPQQIVTCPHCGKNGGCSNMSRYHFDNCKSRP
jgi:hypothetical protein